MLVITAQTPNIAHSPPSPLSNPFCSICQPAWPDGAPVGELQILEKPGRNEMQRSQAPPTLLKAPGRPTPTSGEG